MIEKVQIIKIDENSSEGTEDLVVKEFTAKVFLDGEKISEIPCSPKDLELLAIGHLYSKRKIDSVTGIGIEISGDKIEVLARKSSNPHERKKIHGRFSLPRSVVFDSMVDLMASSERFKRTGGFHTMGLFGVEERTFLYTSEDVSRHSAVEKCIGFLLTKNLSSNVILMSSGRISSSIIEPCVLAGIRFLATKAAVTDRAIEIAKENDVTLLGFVRDGRANIYSGEKRII